MQQANSKLEMRNEMIQGITSDNEKNNKIAKKLHQIIRLFMLMVFISSKLGKLVKQSTFCPVLLVANMASLQYNQVIVI